MSRRPAQPLSAVIYVRLSSYRGDLDPSTSPARQEAVCRAYCEAKGWTVADVVSDLDVSGSDKGLRLNRPGLNKIRDQWGVVDIVIFAKLDRLARNVVDFRAFAEEAETHGAALVSVNESLDLTTPGGKFVATILAAFAEMEAATIAERTTAGMHAARALGRWTGGVAPFGYRIGPHPSGQGKALVPSADAAEIVRELATRALAGETLYALAKDLHTRDVATPLGGKWRMATIQRLLTAPAVVGRQRRHGDYVRGQDGQPLAMWEPLIALADWHRLRAMWEPAADRPQRTRQDYLLSGGIVRCRECGGIVTSGRGRHGVRRYRCNVAGVNCPGVTIKAESLEAHVTAEVLASFGNFEMSRRTQVTVDDGRRAEIEEALATLGREITQPGADVASIAARIAAFSGERDSLPAVAPRVWRVESTGRTWAEEWHAQDLAGRRRMLAETVTVYVGRAARRGVHSIDPGRVTIEGIIDLEAELIDQLASEDVADAGSLQPDQISRRSHGR